MKSFLLLLALSLPFTHAAEARARWVCNAYGYRTGARSVWQTFTGAYSPTRETAARSALRACQSRATACSLSGCWNE